MALKEIGPKKLELSAISKTLSRIYHAGINPQEFSRTARTEDIEAICIASVCNEMMRHIAGHNNAKNKRRSMTFSELCYIWSGILFVFKRQINLLYDETLRQALFTLEYVQRSKTVISTWQKQPAPPALSKKNRARKNDDPIEHLPKKRVKFSNEVEFDWQSLNDIEADDESTIKMLQTSKVMNRDQISIREVVAEPSLPNDLSQCNEFEAVEYSSTENFLQIRELLAQGRSIAHAIQSERGSPMITGDCEPFDEDSYYAPMTPRQSSPRPQTPLSDIDGCYDELDRDMLDQVENVEIEGPASALSYDISLSPLPSKFLQQTRGDQGRRRRRSVIDQRIQIPIRFDEATDKKTMRCTDARLDRVTKDHIMRQLKMINFQKPAHAFQLLQPLRARESVPLRVGMKRVLKAKPKEPTDMNMVEEFLNPSGLNRQEDVQHGDINFGNLQRDDEPQQNRVSRSFKRRHSSSANDMIDERPTPCYERSSRVDDVCALDLGDQDDESMDFMDVAEPIIEPEPISEPEPVSEPEPIWEPEPIEPEQNYEHVPEYEPNLPTVNRSLLGSPSNFPLGSPISEGKSAPISNVSKTPDFRLESDVIPRSILRLLNQFVTVNSTDEMHKGSASQMLLMQSNQKNRKSWGLKGVLQSLFRLWHRNVHPLSMKELLHPETKKLAAALAFYSIMELNSPRIGLIVIEKVENSNAVYNITMSEKLIGLLRKSSRN